MKKVMKIFASCLALVPGFSAAHNECPDCEDRIQTLEEIVFAQHPPFAPGDRLPASEMPALCLSSAGWPDFEGSPWYPNGVSILSEGVFYPVADIRYTRVLVLANNVNRIEAVFNDNSVRLVADGFDQAWVAEQCRYELETKGLI